MTREIKHILVGTDLSARSDRAIHRAFRLAKTHGARITLACIVDDAMPSTMTDTLVQNAEAALTRQAGDIDASVPVEIDVRVGHPSSDMLEIIEAAKPDLLVLGIHRDKVFLAALRETTAQRIVRLSHCPVLVVKDAVDHDYEKIVAATDFSPASAASVRFAHDLAPEATITPVHALQVPYSGMLGTTPDALASLEGSFRAEAQRDLEHWLSEIDIPMEDAVMSAGAIYSVINDQVQHHGASLVTVGAHGRVGAGRAILGSLATDMMRDPPTDVLIARSRR